MRPELLAQLGLAVGDGCRSAAGAFQIRGVIEAEPGRRLGAFSLGPRVIVALPDLDADRAARPSAAGPATSGWSACPTRRWPG